MARSRSRSPRRRSRSRSPTSRHNRRRSRSRDRNSRRRKERSPVSRDRASPDYRRGGSPSAPGTSNADKERQWDREREKRQKEKQWEATVAPAASEDTDKDFIGKTQDEIEMMKVMGFSGFDTTKNKKVKGNNQGDVHVVTKRKYRQYMNRKGGFNRPLDYVH